MLDFTEFEALWEKVKEAVNTMDGGGFLNQDQIDTVRTFNGKIHNFTNWMNENLPRQLFGRSYRKEGDQYILDDNGEYVSMRAPFGGWGIKSAVNGVLFVKKVQPAAPATGKHITPFD